MVERSGFCGKCSACCHTSVPIEPHDDPRLTEFIEYTSGYKRTKTKRNGDCIYLGPNGCTVYEYRPEICREFDCRAEFLRDALIQIQIDKEAGKPGYNSEIDRAALERLITAIGAEDYV